MVYKFSLAYLVPDAQAWILISTHGNGQEGTFFNHSFMTSEINLQLVVFSSKSEE